jgi:hypothetical protein
MSTIKTNNTQRFAVLDLPGIQQSGSSEKKTSGAVSGAPQKVPATKVAAVAAVSEENYYKSVLSVEERVAVALSVGEEIVTAEELSAMYKGEFLIFYMSEAN